MLELNSRRAVLAAALLLVLFVAGNILAGRWLTPVKADLTEDQLYTLSPVTASVLHDLREPVHLRLYWSPRLGTVLPPFAIHFRRVRAILDNYARVAGGKLIVETVEPEPNSDAEDVALNAGARPMTAEQGGDPLFLSLIGWNSTDDVDAIPFFALDRARFLEYDLTRLIEGLAFPKRKVLGLISPIPVHGDPTGFFQNADSKPEALIASLRSVYRIHDLPLDVAKIPSDIDVLMLIQPNNLSKGALYAIDQWVLAGGRVLVLADPLSEVARRQIVRSGNAFNVVQFNLGGLLEAWGAEVPKDHIIGDWGASHLANASGDPNAPRLVPYPAWLELHQQSMERADPVSGRIEKLNMASAGEILPVAGAGTTLTPLIRSTDGAGPIAVEEMKGEVADIDRAGRLLKRTGTRYTLAARLTGPTRTAFPDGPPSGAGDAAPEHQLKELVRPIRVIVVADTDMIDNPVWLKTTSDGRGEAIAPQAQNLEFVQNALDDLVGNYDLSHLRSRGLEFRPFGLVEDMRKSASDRYQSHASALQDQLKDLEAKLKTARSQRALTPEQANEMSGLRAAALSTRAELREVSRSLKREIDSLKLQLVALNTLLVPLLLLVVAVVTGLARQRKRPRRRLPGAPS